VVKAWIYFISSFSFLIPELSGSKGISGVLALPSRDGRRSSPRARIDGVSVGGFEPHEVRFALREVLFLGLGAIGAWLFVNHEILRGGQPPAVDLSAYIVSTIVVYLFIRMIVIAAELRWPRARAELVACPECGQLLHDPSEAGRAAHYRLALARKPTAKMIASAVALQKAVDAAHLLARVEGTESGGPAPMPPGIVENASRKDLLAALHDPDLLERLLHSPNPPYDPRIKR